jgi:hypothetical protein
MEALMQRAFLALGSGVSAPEVAERLQETGASVEEAYLAVKAAEILAHDEEVAIAQQKAREDRERERREQIVTALGIPALKR